MQTNKPVIKAVLILILSDVLLISLLIWWIDATPDISIVELLLVPLIIGVNLIVAAIMYFASKNQSMAIVFAVNSVVAAIIFHYLFKLWFINLDHQNFVNYKFNKAGKIYELLLDRRDTSYSLSERINEGTSIEYKRGKYLLQNGRAVLTDSPRNFVLVDMTLVGFPTVKDTLRTTDK